MRLASYDFTVKHRAGRLHNNADGLSRCRSAASSDTPAMDRTGVEHAYAVAPAKHVCQEAAQKSARNYPDAAPARVSRC